jgi:hypothetical protein
MSEGLQDFDVEEFRLSPSLHGEIKAHQLPPRLAEQEPFIKGPIPFSWVALVSRLPGSCLIVAMAIRYLRSRYPWKAGWSISEIGWRAGLEKQSARRSLRALSEAGLISIVWKPGCKPILDILELNEPEASRSHPLWGPIPWPWWRAASQLPGKAPQVALACWLLAGWERSARFKLDPVWPELGLTQVSTYRGRRALVEAGLVAVTRPRGRTPVVTILDSRSAARS